MRTNGLRLADGATPTRAAASIAVALALASLTGWALGFQPLTSIFPGYVEMKANTALGLILCGMALMLASGRPSRRDLPAQLLAVGALVLGLATLAEYFFGWELGIDELLVRDRLGAFNAFHGRMSPFSACALTALATALLALPHKRFHLVATGGAACGVLIGLVSILGHLWGVREIITDQWLPPVALNTAACFALLGGGILLTPSRDRAARSSGLGSLELRILLGFLFALFLLFVGGGYTYRTNVRFAESVDWVAHTQEVRTLLASLYGSLAGAEVALRDHVLTGSPQNKAEVQNLVAEVGAQMLTLERLTADNPEQRSNLAALKPLVDARVQTISNALVAYADFGVAAARAVIGTGRKTNSTEDVRVLTARMDELEEKLLASRQRAATQVRQTTLLSLLVTLAVASGLFMLLFSGINREMRARRESEEELRESNRFLDSLIDNLPAVVVVKDAATLRVVRQNRAFERLLGFSRDQSIGKHVHDLFSADEAEVITAKDREALDEGRLVDIPEQSIQTGHLGLRIFHTMEMPIGGERDKPQYLLSISFDITERKLAEQAIRELNSALEAKAAQLESSNGELESFSYSVSHDLRAPLRAIDGFALMIEEDFSGRLDAEGRRYLGVIRDNSKRMGMLIDDLLAFSRMGRLPVVAREVNMDSLVREVIDEALNGCSPPPRIEVGPLPAAHGDRSMLRQVWTNLIANAIKYSSKQKSPIIEVSGRQNASENLYSIRDNGVGFDMDYANKLFGVFQRLHRNDEFTGTGVGLAIVHRVVSRHGGRVWAESKLNAGALFSFTLPEESYHG